MKFDSIYEIIGRTPLIKINNNDEQNIAQILVKVESFNPAGSIKDRAALYMIKNAEDEGILKKGGTIIEPTSGNTGIAIAMIGAVKGYKVIIVMPDTMSIERRKLMEGYGAKVILTEGKYGMAGSVEFAKKLADENGYFMPDQFDNINNVKAHYETTGLEILEDTKGNVDAFVAGVGTGGTITGVGKRLKEVNPNTLIVAVEPKKSPLLSEGKVGPHGIQGIGANFVPSILDKSIIDEIIQVDEKEAYIQVKKLGKSEGILCGISSGANMFAAIKVAKKLGKDKTVVTVLPDTGERYLSTDLFNGA
ncbi:cysteine synthase [Keratinibaculum paraultunense]|uniref:Cysteine synthase n=1 Tax=Keratinibaculum paraultunense TaxID=1278232 RepID=A0A4R3KZM4_9FIRM|nr:cysteine synthase A [Keratinibaculum paraultunense]QQY80345.1 cysteine synthase A [Keratinibaculum paraultunense]TCS90867.1 cysteine synthase [Keratinibaculum paraultunense]